MGCAWIHALYFLNKYWIYIFIHTITSGHYSISLLPLFFFSYYFAIRWCSLMLCAQGGACAGRCVRRRCTLCSIHLKMMDDGMVHGYKLAHICILLLSLSLSFLLSPSLLSSNSFSCVLLPTLHITHLPSYLPYFLPSSLSFPLSLLSSLFSLSLLFLPPFL